MRKFTLLFAVLLSLVGVTANADELTVYDGVGASTYIPLQGSYADTKGSLSEFIMPATALTEMSGSSISKMTFYISSVAASKWTSTFTVYMKEIEETEFESSSAIGSEGATVVYTGELDGTASTMDVDFDTNFDYNGGNLLIGFEVTTATSVWKAATFVGVTQSANTAFYNKSSKTRVKFLPKTTFTYGAAATDGAAFNVKNGSTKLSSPYAYSFGLATAGTTKVFTLSNPGTEATPIAVNTTGANGFTAVVEDNATSIPAGGEVTLTITMPDATASGSIVVTPTGEGLDPFTFNVSGTVRDANKLYESGFTALPEDWTTTGSWYYSAANGAYTTVWYLSSNARLVTPKLTIAEGEKFNVEAKGYSTSNTSYQHLQMQYSADGSTWTNFDDEPSLDPSNWQTFEFTGVPAGNYYIAINASQADIRMFYGGQLPVEPKFAVDASDYAFGIIEENTTSSTFTISNSGKATLTGVSVTSNNSTFTVSSVPTSIAAGESETFTVTMSADNVGAQNGTITVSATGFDPVEFNVSGAVMPNEAFVVDFEEGLPEKWNNASWTFNDGVATGKSSSAYLTTPVLEFSEGDFIVIKAKRTDSDASDYITIQGSNDKGSTWTAYSKKISGSDGLASFSQDWSTLILTDIPTTVNKLRFVGYYVQVDEIVGLNYAPVLEVEKGGQGCSSPDSYDFGKCGTDANVTYNFTNYGGGIINITNVAITGEGAAAYSTNWSESVAVPFDLVITRTYDAERVGVSEAVITVTTTEGDYIINVSGSDLSADAPALSVTYEEAAVTTGDVADFGSQLQEAPKAKTYSITNSGTGTLTGTIYSSSEKVFTVNATSFNLAAGENMSFEIALIFDENYGSKEASIIIHPTNDGLEDIVINATASTLDPEAWREDFSAGSLPTGWVASSWTVGTYSNYENKTTMALAPSGNSAGTLITPCLTAKEGDVLTWDAYYHYYDEAIKVEWSNNGTDWTEFINDKYAESGSYSVTYHKAMSFTAPADGNYYLRFTSTYQNGVDNFCGFKLNLPEHIMAITASSIPTSGSYSPSMKATQSFNATVTVKESRGVDEENVVAKFYMGEEVIGTSETTTVEAGETKVINITCTPTEAATEGVLMHIEVEWAGDKLSTEAVTRYVAEFVTLNLTENAEEEITTGYSPVYDQVTLTRNFAAGWNTFVSPVAVTISDIHEDAIAYSFTGFSDEELKFTKVSTSLNPATPYVIYVPEAINNKEFAWNKPVIYSSYVGEENIKVTQNEITFQGTYAPIAKGDMEGKYGVTPAGKIQKGGANASIKGFRAYFDLPVGSEVKALVFEDTTDGVKTLRVDDKENQDIYDLSGRKMNAAQKGIYVVGGRKVIIK